MSEKPTFDDNNKQMTMIDGAVIERDYVYIAQYFDKHEEYADEIEASRMASVDLSNVAEPWMDQDLRSKIVSVCVWRTYPQAKRLYVALGLHGRIHMVGPGGEPAIIEMVPGDVLDDFSGLVRVGTMSKVREIGRSLYVCGSSRQVYRRRPDTTWQPIHGPMLVRRSRGDQMDTIRFLSDIGGQSEDSIYVCGNEGEVFFYDGLTWREVQTDIKRSLHGIAIETSGTVFIIGAHGALLSGNHTDGFKSLVRSRYYYTGIAIYNDTIYLASNLGLLTYNRVSDTLRHCQTGLEPELIDCHRLDAYDGVLWSFGFKDLAYFDGSRWTRVQNPDNPPI